MCVCVCVFACLVNTDDEICKRLRREHALKAAHLLQPLPQRRHCPAILVLAF